MYVKATIHLLAWKQKKQIYQVFAETFVMHSLEYNQAFKYMFLLCL
jgi:hypothetical protein